MMQRSHDVITSSATLALESTTDKRIPLAYIRIVGPLSYGRLIILS